MDVLANGQAAAHRERLHAGQARQTYLATGPTE